MSSGSGRGRRREGRGSGPSGCLGLLLILCIWPFYLAYKLYQFAWNKPSTRRGKILSVSGVSLALLVLVIVGSAAGGTPAPKTPLAAVATSTPSAAPTTLRPTVTHTAKPKTAVTHVTKPKPLATHTAKATYAPRPTPTYSAPAPVETHTAPAEIPTTHAAAAPSCYPLTNGGNCYEPGEFCRKSDHGATGVAGDGKSITCEDVNGWRWED